MPYGEHRLPDIVMITLLAVMPRVNEWGEGAEFARTKEPWLPLPIQVLVRVH
jgi:hypothetical protein